MGRLEPIFEVGEFGLLLAGDFFFEGLQFDALCFEKFLLEPNAFFLSLFHNYGQLWCATVCRGRAANYLCFNVNDPLSLHCHWIVIECRVHCWV